jgi:nonsense-mediated mRNA decay protein 3
MGYDIDQTTHADLDEYARSVKGAKHHLPDVVLVRKAYPNVRKRMNKRYWKLKELEKERMDDENFHAARKKASKNEGNQYENQRAMDEKLFKQDIEEIPELREEI